MDTVLKFENLEDGTVRVYEEEVLSQEEKDNVIKDFEKSIEAINASIADAEAKKVEYDAFLAANSIDVENISEGLNYESSIKALKKVVERKNEKLTKLTNE